MSEKGEPPAVNMDAVLLCVIGAVACLLTSVLLAAIGIVLLEMVRHRTALLRTPAQSKLCVTRSPPLSGHGPARTSSGEEGESTLSHGSIELVPQRETPRSSLARAVARSRSRSTASTVAAERIDSEPATVVGDGGMDSSLPRGRSVRLHQRLDSDGRSGI